MNGAKIINALKEAIADDLARVWIDGVCWEPRRKWETMDTAPRDGTPIDLWCYCRTHGEWERRTDCAWETMTDWIGNEYDGWSGWADIYCAYDEPSHWMPRPEPPEGDR